MKKGFTLVELLAVIVILAIVLAITIPTITGIFSKVTMNAFVSDANMILKGVDYQLLQDSTYLDDSINKSKLITDLDISAMNYEEITLSYTADKKVYIYIKGKEKWDGLVACGTFNNILVGDGSQCEIPTEEEPTIVNPPELVKGLFPVIWDETINDWVQVSADDPDWYDYSPTKKQWANAVTYEYVDGVKTDNIIAYWVWIPRYAYKITKGWQCQDITCKYYGSSDLPGDAGVIEISFSEGTDDTNGGKIIINNTCNLNEDNGIEASECANDANGKWSNHPAFDFGEEKLTGLWVAKFKISVADQTHQCYLEDPGHLDFCNDINIVPNIIPEANIWHRIDIGKFFTVARKMEADPRYGWNTASVLQEDGTYLNDNNGFDIHLMKNTEWGAMAYLAHSKYGINNNDLEPSAYFIKGNGDEIYDNIYWTTSGNVYGVYSLAVLSGELVTAYIDNDNSCLTAYGSSIINAKHKYKNAYLKAVNSEGYENYLLNYEAMKAQKGDALYETSSNIGYSWWGGNCNIPSHESPWFTRGSKITYENKPPSANLFSFSSMWCGNINFNISGGRPIIVVGANL